MRDAELYARFGRANFAAFLRMAFLDLHPGKRFHDDWYIDVLADRLARCLTGEIKRLIINLPPRTSKSFAASVAFLVYALGRDPTLKILSIGGSRELASDFRAARLALASSARCRAAFPHLKFRSQSGVDRLPYGGVVGPGIAGHSLIGRGADIIVIDDPLSPSEAWDDNSRNAINAWYDSEVVTRLNDKGNGVIIIVMQRLHPDDLTGHLLGGPEKWTQLSIPAVAMRDEVWRLSTGEEFRRGDREVLSEARENRNMLIERLIQMGARDFMAQYQQLPYVPYISGDIVCGTWTYGRYPENWVPGMGMPPFFLGDIPQWVFLLKELFEVGEPPRPFDEVRSIIPPESRELDGIIRQRRLVAWAQGGGPRPEATPLEVWGLEKADPRDRLYFGHYRPMRGAKLTLERNGLTSQ